jgi:hypothetical protein
MRHGFVAGLSASRANGLGDGGEGMHVWLFHGPAPEHIELERTRVLAGEDGVTHLRHRARR